LVGAQQTKKRQGGKTGKKMQANEVPLLAESMPTGSYG
jgi:hypothetical protein